MKLHRSSEVTEIRIPYGWIITIDYSFKESIEVVKKIQQLHSIAFAYGMSNSNSPPLDLAQFLGNPQLQSKSPLCCDQLQLNDNSVAVGPKSTAVVSIAIPRENLINVSKDDLFTRLLLNGRQSVLLPRCSHFSSRFKRQLIYAHACKLPRTFSLSFAP